MEALLKLQQLVVKALDPEHGCQWLQTLDMLSVGQYTLEESYELLHALEQNDASAIQSELADLCYHLLIYAELARRLDWFDLESIFAKAIEKLETRQMRDAKTPEEAHQYWQQQKQQSTQSTSILDDIPENMPAILRAYKLQERAAGVNFDWPTATDAIPKLHEETQELIDAIAKDDREEIEHELGDLLFTCVNLARHLHINPEQALRKSNQKFEKRFAKMEANIKTDNKQLLDIDFNEWEKRWQEAKKQC